MTDSTLAHRGSHSTVEGRREGGKKGAQSHQGATPQPQPTGQAAGLPTSPALCGADGGRWETAMVRCG